MHLSISTKGLDAVRAQINSLSRGQLKAAAIKAVNDVAFQNVRPAMQDEMRKRFDRPTDYILSSPRVVVATAAQTFATIEPAYRGGKGVDPQKILNAQAWGGRRRDKRSEVALRRAGILPAGMQTAIPSSPFPGSADGHGNLKGPFLVQLLSYFQAFGEQGYRANMKDARKKALLKRGGARLKDVGPQMGRRYIVSYGAMRAGARWAKHGDNDKRMSNLPPGIWAVVGRTGADIRPVLMFVRSGTYTPRLDMDQVILAANVEENLQRRMRYRIRSAAENLAKGAA